MLLQHGAERFKELKTLVEHIEQSGTVNPLLKPLVRRAAVAKVCAIPGQEGYKAKKPKNVAEAVSVPQRWDSSLSGDAVFAVTLASAVLERARLLDAICLGLLDKVRSCCTWTAPIAMRVCS